MKLSLTSPIEILTLGPADPCLLYAQDEAVRLLTRLGARPRPFPVEPAGGDCTLRIGPVSPDAMPTADGVRDDGYRLRIVADGAAIATRCPKGVLNGLYDLAERLGVLFLFPREAGEWLPERPVTPLDGDFLVNPRYPWRGVARDALDKPDYSDSEWMVFYAKLRMNAVMHHPPQAALCRKLGIRLEVGGHGLSHLVPRDLFEQEPDAFRMNSAFDLHGVRVPDSNFCATSPVVARLLREGYARQCREMDGVYAAHVWPDDLACGGWCYCPSCRGYRPSDQSALATRHLAEGLRQANPAMRIPLLAYHDTLFPGRQIPLPPEAFLFYAPRERCYRHAIDDDACPRNRHYRRALDAWMAVLGSHGDPHTFEYYCDQLLFRGMYPYTPETILGDLRAYRDHGIETLFALQIGGATVALDANMLLFAAAHWDETLTKAAFESRLAARLAPDSPEAWRDYLAVRGRIFTEALAMCEHDNDSSLYFDFRWLPETTAAFGRRMAACYEQAADALEQAATALTAAVRGAPAVTALAAAEQRRSRFEAAELRVMAVQQTAVNALAACHAGANQTDLDRACKALENGIKRLEAAGAFAGEAGLLGKSWYYEGFNRDLTAEFAAKAHRCRKAMAASHSPVSPYFENCLSK